LTCCVGRSRSKPQDYLLNISNANVSDRPAMK
jgi:hypothetical protein